MFRLLAILGVTVTLSTGALASFELLLVADNGANTTATRRIHRFDPDSGVYLGAFGNFSSDIRSMTIRQSRGEAYVVAGNTTYVFDYSTGALKRDFSFTGFTDIAFSQDEAFFYGVTGGSAIYRTTTAQIDSGTFSPTAWVSEVVGTQISSVAVTNSGMVMTGQNRGGSLFEYRYDSAGVGVTSTSFSAGVTIGAAENVPGGGAFQSFTFSGNGRYSRYGSAGTAISGVAVATGIGTATAASAAHSGGYVVGIDLATPTQGLVTRFSASLNEMQSFGGSVLRKPVAMSSVLAPEPGTMIALGAGVLALLRRRKR